MKLLPILLCMSCTAVTDVFDGDIDQVEHCCWKFTGDKIRACMVDFLEPCSGLILECPAPIGEIKAFVNGFGEPIDFAPVCG